VECECGVFVNISCLKRHQRGSNCKLSVKYDFISDEKLEKISKGECFKCECGGFHTTRKDKHIKTQMHIDFINKQIQT
jgi:Zn ribbon nucleic-acid-binding protein